MDLVWRFWAFEIDTTLHHNGSSSQQPISSGCYTTMTINDVDMMLFYNGIE